MSTEHLICLINHIKEKYKTYYSLRQKYLIEKKYQKNEIRKMEIRETEQIISQLNEDINNYINKYRQILQLKQQIDLEKQNEKKITEKNKKISEFIQKGKDILTNNISYYKKLPDYSNKKLKKVKMSPLDLINFTLRIGQQNKAPIGEENYFFNYIPFSINNEKNVTLLYSEYYIKNQNRFLYPYPNDNFGFANTILRYDLSEKNRLLPPILVSPNPSYKNENGEILANKGKDLIFKYPKDNPPSDIFFKYSKDPNILPSFFTGEEYKDYSHPNLDKDLTVIKVCTCKKGYKDSKIVTFKFVIDSNETVEIEKKEVDLKARGDFVIRPEDHIDSGSLKFEAIQSSSSLGSPHGNTSRPGTSSYEPVYYNPEGNNDDEESDL